MVPTDWVVAIANPKAGNKTNLDFGNHEIHDLETLWEDMKTRGLMSPFTLAAGRYERNCRLESGNHRVKVFLQKGIPFIPASTLVADDARINATNGDHQYQRPLRLPPQDYNMRHLEERVYMKPTDVFVELHRMNIQGLLPRPVNDNYSGPTATFDMPVNP